MVQSWYWTIDVVQSWNKEDKKQNDERWIFASYLKKKNSTPLKQ